MDYSLAILAGKTAMVLVALSSGYYLLHILFAALERGGMHSWRLKTAVHYARVSHPFLASLISLSVIYHVYVMWMTHSLGVKVGSGIAVSVMVALMANSGWALRLRLHSHRLRQSHRLGMYLLFVVLFGHRLL
jgi:hypothetical protein